MLSDTIAAIATPPGEGGVGIIRISGPDAVAAAAGHFRAMDGKALADQPVRLLQFGKWVNGAGKLLDEVMCVRFEAPHSFTGEDVVEVHAHGGAFHLRTLLTDLLDGPIRDRPLRLAQPGEFTQRAFVNGKMDLTQAEAVADLIRSGTELARDAAARQLAGALHKAVDDLRTQVKDLCAQVEASVDFPEEEEQLLPRAELLTQVREARKGMLALLDTAKEGRMVSQGIRVVIAGAPNAGKSSLMNALLGRERAIVTEIAGTTRDYLEERLSIQGFPVLLTDTAGLRESVDAIEQEGVKRSRERLGGADVLLLILDSARDLSPEDFEALEATKAEALVVIHKSDLDPKWDVTALPPKLRAARERIQAVSSKTAAGLDELKVKIVDLALRGRAAKMADSVALTQERHEDAMRRAEAAMGQVENSLSSNAGPELLAPDLRSALDALGEIVGATSRDEILSAIFSKFCIGK